MSGIKIPNKPSKQHKESSLSDLLNKDIQFGNRSLSDSFKEQFYSELATLLHAGLDLRMGLEMIIDSYSKHKELLQELKENVIQGESLSVALQKSTRFSEYEFYTIQIGEETGKLVEVLTNLSDYYKKRIKQKRQVISALSYPVIVLCVAFGAIFFMLYFIVPMFSDIFKRFDSELPSVTKLIITLSEGLMAIFPYALGGILIISVILYINRTSEWYLNFKDKLITALPFFGSIYKQSQLAQFNSIMSLLIGANIHLLQALELSEKITRYTPIKKAIASIKNDITQGKPFHQALKPFPVFDSKMVSLLKVGEEVNELEKFFGKIASNYSDEVDHKTSVLGNFIEPFLLIFLGIVVGTILIAMYLPMFKLSSSFG